MTWIVPVAIAAAAVVPCTVLVLYLVLRKSPEAAGGEFAPSLVQHEVDLLAERDDADFTAAADAIRMRTAQEALKHERTHSENPPDAIVWSEPDIPYRPESIEPAALFSSLGIPINTKLAPREHRVFISQTAFERIESHLRSNTSVELGGLLVGQPFYAPSVDAYLVVIHDGYAADEGKETAVSFEYTSNTWRRMTPKLQEMPPEYVVVGSYHSHPGIGVFLSATDIDTQVSVFSQPWQIALVIDPIKSENGFFISPEGIPVKFDVF